MLVLAALGGPGCGGGSAGTGTGGTTGAGGGVPGSGGITGIVTMPWMFYTGPTSTLAEKIDAMRRFRKDMRLDG